MANGNTTEVFDLILEATQKPISVSIDVTKISRADSSSTFFLTSLAIMSTMESLNISVRHRFAESSYAYSVLEDAQKTSDKFNCELVDDPPLISLFNTRPKYSRSASLLIDSQILSELEAVSLTRQSDSSSFSLFLSETLLFF